MEVFVWNMAISFQLLFVILSSAIFIYLRERSFKFYALYNIFLSVYVISRNDVYYNGLTNFVARFVGNPNAPIFIYVFFFLIQIIFYTFYSHFALYFLDLDRHSKKYFSQVILTLHLLGALMVGISVISYYTSDIALPMTLFTFVYLPSLLAIFVATVIKAVRFSGKHKTFFLIGISLFVFFGLIAFIGSRVESLNIKDPINFFYIGIILETLFFSLGLAHKIKILNDEKNRARREIIKSKHRQQLGKLHGLLEGQEKERKRLAEELHDGIASDLSAIKYNLSILKQDPHYSQNGELLRELTQIIDKSCIQLREISHNLSSSTITNLGLVTALQRFCVQSENVYGISINLNFTGEPLMLNQLIETHLYRIIQELVTNIVKHSGAHKADIEIVHEYPYLNISVKDDGRGFVESETYNGIGLSNINSRVRFLNATIKKDSDKSGSIFNIEIDLRKIPHA